MVADRELTMTGSDPVAVDLQMAGRTGTYPVDAGNQFCLKRFMPFTINGYLKHGSVLPMPRYLPCFIICSRSRV